VDASSRLGAHDSSPVRPRSLRICSY
jgi:hypothetical protein